MFETPRSPFRRCSLHVAPDVSHLDGVFHVQSYLGCKAGHRGSLLQTNGTPRGNKRSKSVGRG